MHISGKVLMFLVIIAAGVAAVFSAKMVHVRNSWLKKADQAESTLVKNKIELAERTKVRNELRAELAREIRGWNQTWDALNMQQSAQGGGSLASTEVGTVNGMKAAVIYIFQPDPDGDGAKFVGSFRATPAENQTPFAPTFKVRPSKLPDWQPGGAGWRIRQSIPTASISRFSDLMLDLQKLDEELIYRQRNVQTQNALAADAQLKLDKRSGELNGEPDNGGNASSLPSWMIVGLVKAIEDDEEKRNAVLEEVDGLRRVIKKTYDQIQKIKAQNIARAQRLPGSEPTTVGSNDVGQLETAEQ